MSTQAIINMVLVLGFVIGGFAAFLLLALRKETRRKPD